MDLFRQGMIDEKTALMRVEPTNWMNYFTRYSISLL